MSTVPTVLIVPGLRDHVAQHWQTLLEARLRAAGRAVASVPPMGREDLDCATKVAAIERTVRGALLAAHMLAMADELFGLVRAGKIVGEPKQSFALADAAEAHRALESRRTTGATVLVP